MPSNFLPTPKERELFNYLAELENSLKGQSLSRITNIVAHLELDCKRLRQERDDFRKLAELYKSQLES